MTTGRMFTSLHHRVLPNAIPRQHAGVVVEPSEFEKVFGKVGEPHRNRTGPASSYPRRVAKGISTDSTADRKSLRR